MSTFKTLTEEIDEIVKSKQTKTAKKIAIIKLGIRDKEANFLLIGLSSKFALMQGVNVRLFGDFICRDELYYLNVRFMY